MASEGKKGYVIFRDVHGVVRCQDDPEFLRVHQEATLVCPDGMPLVWIGKRRGYKEMGRVYGPDMMRELMNATRDGSATHYLYGGKEGVAEQLKTSLESQYPGVKIVGTCCPPFAPLSPEKVAELQTTLSELKPDFFWVGLSTPKQEFFMNEYLPKLETTVMLGVGAAFDYLSGAVKEPPTWIQRSGFQWLYRICSEPRRLFGRYLNTVPRFLWLLSKESLQKKS
ncbi:WecB/TagA/CpsF family glycosyltransferase [Kiritimatiellaeota bacterium B1221]|nr:WecB/TagA/CpsF family glycosyltransferase [Kiritimatiellaeota bacterium B1221]